MNDLLLNVCELSTVIPTDDGLVHPVREVSFSLYRGKTLGVVGESGCGKSMTGLSLLQLIPRPGYIQSGTIEYYDGASQTPIRIDRLKADQDEMREIRGNKIAMIFQEPMSSLNPVYTIGEQIGEAVRIHQRTAKKEAREIAIGMLERVGIPGPQQRVDEYPHQLSGGMRQRAMIAMALCCRPELLIADEPTTALDVTIQAQILDLLKDLQSEMNMAIMMITHDLGVIADLADEIMVMYAGQIVETGSPDHIFYEYQHPYSQGLLASIPQMGSTRTAALPSISGTVPSTLHLPNGCSFLPRCKYATDQCTEAPAMSEVEPSHYVRCWHRDEVVR